jgi:hypothetical protein
MACNYVCNKLCNNLIISNSITVVTIDGTDTLLIDIPSSTYRQGEVFCIVTAQSIPTTATVTMPVAISIGGDTTNIYPLVCSKTCLQAVACQVNARRKYKVVVSTNTSSGVFKAIYGLNSYCAELLPSLPVVAGTAVGAGGSATPEVANVVQPVSVASVTPTTRATKSKEVAINE